MKKHIFLLSFLLFTCLISNSSMAQKENHDFVLLPDGKTVFGNIDYKFNQVEFHSISFTDEKGFRKEYNPNDILGFGLESGRLYYSFQQPETSKKVFFQMLFEGKLSLLSHKGLYYINNGEEIILLEKQDKKQTSSNRQISIAQKYPHISMLKILTTGVCGIRIKDEISNSTYTAQSLIDVLVLYHSCEKYPYEVIMDRIPKFKISPVLIGGIGTFHQILNFREGERKDVIQTEMSPTLQAGIKIHQLREMPRLGFDIGLGINFQNYSYLLEQKDSEALITGEQKFSTKNFYMPIFFNYLFTSNEKIDTYAGIGALLGLSIIDSHHSVIYEKATYSNYLTIYDFSFVERKKTMANPTFKIGSHFKPSQKLGFIIEYQISYALRSSNIPYDNMTSIFSEINNSFLIGLRF
jgi:hypothetical protein